VIGDEAVGCMRCVWKTDVRLALLGPHDRKIVGLIGTW
jgi:hypothetical protein